VTSKALRVLLPPLQCAAVIVLCKSGGCCSEKCERDKDKIHDGVTALWSKGAELLQTILASLRSDASLLVPFTEKTAQVIEKAEATGRDALRRFASVMVAWVLAREFCFDLGLSLACYMRECGAYRIPGSRLNPRQPGDWLWVS
jgi:hypothetical protein